MNSLPVDFADPWEHVRLLSDRPRNDALLTLLARRAPGKRVVEVGCGTGLLSCVAARLGASHVWAVESTPLAEAAEALIRHNGLSSKVTVLQDRVENVPIQPVDLAFSELLNADPFSEGVIEAMDSVAPWVVPGGVMSPTTLKVYVALAWADEASQEFSMAADEVARICQTYGLEPGPLADTLAVRHPHRYVTHAERPVSTIALAMELPIGTGSPVPERVTVEVRATVDGEIGGAMFWFSAEVDDDLWMSNPPGAGTHWGQMVCGWPRVLRVRRGQVVTLELTRYGRDLTVMPAAGQGV